MTYDARERERQEAEVDAMIRANAAGNTGDAGQHPAPDTQQAGEYVGQPGTPQPETQGDAAPGADDSQPATPEPQHQRPPEGDTQVDEETWKSKFLSLRGKYDAEVPRLHQELREAKEQMSTLQGQINSLREQPAAPPGQPQTAEPDTNDAIDALKREYGTELAEGVRALIRAERPAPQPQPQPQQERGPTPFISELASELAVHGVNYYRQNRDPQFLEWLKQYDADDSVYTRLEQLDAAVKQQDTAKVAAFFTRYAASSGRIGADPSAHRPNPLSPHAQVPDGGAGETPVPHEVTFKQAEEEYFSDLDKVARGQMTEEELAEGSEKRYYAFRHQMQQQQAG